MKLDTRNQPVKHLNWHLGQAWANPGQWLIYVPIPKNATTWTTHVLQMNGWKPITLDYTTVDNRQYVVALRDPIQRWVSGISEYFYHNHRDLYQTVSDNDSARLVLEQLVESQLVWDVHTADQTFFLHGIDPAWMIFFKIDQTYSAKFTQWLIDSGNGGGDPHEILGPVHLRQDNPDKSKWITLFQDLLVQRPGLMAKIQEHYDSDFYYYNRCEHQN